MKSIGLDPAKLLCCSGGASQYKCDGEILRMFKRLKDEKRFVEPVQFLVRQQPHDNLKWNGFDPNAGTDFMIDEPGISKRKKKESEIRKSDDDSLVNSLRFSDVIVTLCLLLSLTPHIMTGRVLLYL